MWLKLFFLLLYFLVLFVLARFFEAIVWYETGIFATQLVDPVALSFKKLKTILECRGLGYSGLPEKKDVRELVEKSGDLMEGELYSALKEEEASESVSSTNFSGEMHFYELVEDTKDGIWLVQVIANDRSPLVGKIHWEKMVKKVSRFGIRTGTFNCSSDPRNTTVPGFGVCSFKMSLLCFCQVPVMLSTKEQFKLISRLGISNSM
ncbi:E3 ubiquitin-protein ligase RNF103 isoform X5 [Lagenorhynchus albirostris]|uniref:E3 ubiquitin-protein ligase RNF103 isoform X5 n=1 Tax=Lagenorhynchus albirostris TaxID=27610 RepID=UPI0028E61D8D|nr:E3 ubiquitin-protein ligase RNF103 isoform X5 [Lagenorhynchus albirostris]